MGDTRVTDEKQELSELVNEPRIVTVGGRDVAVTPIRTRELPAFMRSVEPLFGLAATGAGVAEMVLHNADAVIQATAIGARVERDWIDGLDLAELLLLAAAIMEVNADFFVRRLGPALTLAMGSLSVRLAGMTLSSASSAQATTETT